MACSVTVFSNVCNRRDPLLLPSFTAYTDRRGGYQFGDGTLSMFMTGGTASARELRMPNRPITLQSVCARSNHARPVTVLSFLAIALVIETVLKCFPSAPWFVIVPPVFAIAFVAMIGIQFATFVLIFVVCGSTCTPL